MIATTVVYQILQDWRPNRLYCYFRLSVVVAIARDQFLRADVVETPIFAVGIVILSVIAPEICVFGFGGHIAISSCRLMLQRYTGWAS